MTDLTVLVSPIPLYSGPDSAQRFNPFGSLRANRSRGHIKPVMVTLESEREEAQDRDYDQPQLQNGEERRGRELHRLRPEEAGSNSHRIRSDPASPDPNPDSAGSESGSPIDLPTSSGFSSTPSPSPSPSTSFAPPYTSSTPLPASAFALSSPRSRSRSRRPHKSREPHTANPNPSTNPNTRPPTDLDPNLLSPPVNTWKSRPPPGSGSSRPRHRPTRSQSAPPERRASPGASSATEAASPTLQYFGSTTALSPTTTTTNSTAFGYNFGYNQPPLLLGGPGPALRTQKRSFGAFNTHTSNRQTTQGGELVRPPPPLLRPTTFWRKTRRSGVTGASYSPSSHLIRRATYVAAGLPFDAPVHDLSALCVESRVGFIVVPPVEGVL